MTPSMHKNLLFAAAVLAVAGALFLLRSHDSGVYAEVTLPDGSTRALPLDDHCLPRVTPGRSSALARAEPAKLLMKVDFPTFGIPASITRMRAPDIPFPALRASNPASSSSMALRTGTPPERFLLLTARHASPLRVK